MKNVKSCLLIGAILLSILSPISSFAAFDEIFFSINGDTTLTTMTQGDEFGWGSNCNLGATINWQIYFDVNNNSIINPGIDILLASENLADGNLLYESNPIPDGMVFSGTFFLGTMPGNYIFKAYDIVLDSSLQKIVTMNAMPSPPNQFTGQIIIPALTPPHSLLANRFVFAESENGDEGFFGAITDINGNYTMNITSAGTGVDFYIGTSNINNFVTPDENFATANGVVSNIDFTYINSVDSVYGFVRDGFGNLLPYETDVKAYTMFNEENTKTVNGRYVIYFSSGTKGDYFLSIDGRLSPIFLEPPSFEFSHDTLGSFQHDIYLTRSDAVIYARVTEDGGEPVNSYRIDSYSSTLNRYGEAVSGTGSNNIVAVPASSLDFIGWMVSLAQYSDEYPIPGNLTVQVGFHNNVSPGDTVTFSLTSGSGGCCKGMTGNADNDPNDLTDIGDVTFLIDFLFISNNPPVCFDEANADGMGIVDIGDLTALIDFLFISNTPPAPCISECSFIDTIIVTTSPQLSFTWEPACQLMGWNIEPVGSGADQWLVLYEGSNSIEPPITYGVVPAGATEIHPPETLIPGTTYKIVLFQWTGPGAQDGVVIDSTTFTM